MGHTWAMHGSHMGDTWATHGLHMGGTWAVRTKQQRCMHDGMQEEVAPASRPTPAQEAQQEGGRPEAGCARRRPSQWWHQAG